MSRAIVTSALPYANGRLHLGHVAGAYLPADIFVRWLRLNKQDVIYICGTDEHGAPITISAEAEGVSPQVVVDRYHKSIADSFAGLNIEFDNFSGTARPLHHKMSQEFFMALLLNDYITTHNTRQFYCEHDHRFLPDRYVEGICPLCGYENARGDQCDACGRLMETESLKEPRCKLCGNTPVIKETTHWFLNLPKFAPLLKDWLAQKKDWKENVLNFITAWIESGLIERSITRDLSWGVPVPVTGADGKVLYVWFDAPIGYISATMEWANNIGKPAEWKKYWQDPDTKVYHFIGKDNIPFHAIIWPAILMGQREKYNLPYDIPANEYLTLEGEKISTSRNYAVWVEEYLQEFDGELLRYFLAANAPENKDADFSWKDFQNRVNTELANVLGNLANRVFTFVKNNFDGRIEKPDTNGRLAQAAYLEARAMLEEISQAYGEFRVRKVAKLGMDLARLGNRYFDESKVWQVIKENRQQAAEHLYVCLQILRYLTIAFTPIMPATMQKLRQMMNLSTEVGWDDLRNSPDAFSLGEISTLFNKITDDIIEQQIAKLAVKPAEHKPDVTPVKEQVIFDDFAKIDLRLGKVVKAERIKKSKKLLLLQVDDGMGERQIVAGLALAYQAENLLGKTVVMLVNLPPREIAGYESCGMILAVGEGEATSVLVPDKSGLLPGNQLS